MSYLPIEEIIQKTITRIMDELNVNPAQQSTDPNISIAYKSSELLGPIDSIPESLKEVIKRAKYLDFVDKKMVTGSRLWEFNKQQIDSFLAKVDNESIPWIYDVADGRQRINITLRLWAGSSDAAKSLRKTYASLQSDGSANEEVITPDMRTKAFKESINPKASSDPIYYAGVEAALVLKRLRNESIFTDGIPADSPVMNYLNT